MKLGRIAVALLALSACDQRAAPLAAYRHPIDAAESILPLNLFGVYSCASRRKIDGVNILEGLPLDQCYKMQPARRFRGIWLDEFEGSTFFEGFSDIGKVKSEIRLRMKKPAAYGEWLGWNENRKNPVLSSSGGDARLVAIDFVGRKTAYLGRYGHMGMSNSEIIVDRVISAQPIYRASTSYIEDELNRDSPR